MDYRYETNDDIRKFHKQRIAFIIIEGKLHIIKNSELSHWEYCEKMHISKKKFNKYIRGYYLNGNAVFYKDNFSYDENVINVSLKYLPILRKECELNKINIYFGVKMDTNLKVWPPDYYYGIINEKDEIIPYNDELDICLDVDKEPYMNTITNDKVINITGQSGAGKSTYIENNYNSDDYIIIDTDVVIGSSSMINNYCKDLKDFLNSKYGVNKLNLADDFDKRYDSILDYFKDTDKT